MSSGDKESKVVIIGGVAAGPKTGSRIARLCPDMEITLIEKGEFLSYAGCGLPYYISGVIKERGELMNTPSGAVRDAEFFHNVKNIQVCNRTQAMRINRKEKTVTIRSLRTNQQEDMAYDYLVLATGATPTNPPFEGIDLLNVFNLNKVEDAEAIMSVLESGDVRKVAIIGGGLIGAEMAESFHARGLQVCLIEKLPQLLPSLDEDMSLLISRYMEDKGVRIATDTTVTRLSGKSRVESVITQDGKIFDADVVLIATGVRPNSQLAHKAGLEIGDLGGIKVNEKLQISDPDIYAAGDCVQNTHRITGKPCYVPLGSTANKQGRVVANNICERPDRWRGVLGTNICKIFDYAVGSTGLTEKQACANGYEVLTVLSPAPDKAHYYPAAKPIFMKLVVDQKSRRLLGVQVIGPGGVDKRIDTAATAITAGMTVDMIAELDLAYAPPFAPAMDNLITAANIARNKLDGYLEGVSPQDVKAKIDRKEAIVLLDVRSLKEYESMHLSGSVCIPLGKLREEYERLPRGKEIITFCKLSLRGYEAALILKSKGFTDVKVMDGGLLMWPYEGIIKS